MQITAQHCDASPLKRTLLEAELLHRPHQLHFLITWGGWIGYYCLQRTSCDWCKPSSAAVILALASETLLTILNHFLLFPKQGTLDTWCYENSETAKLKCYTNREFCSCDGKVLLLIQKMNVTLQYGSMTKLLNNLNVCLKEQLVTVLRRTEAKLDLDLTNTQDMFQHITVEVLLGNTAIPQ